jgi:glycosyltransferase involved in cell wall biosynthesis
MAHAFKAGLAFMSEISIQIMKAKPIVLVPVRYFLPAYKAGGPVRTLKAMIEHLSGTYQFHVLALDRDLGEYSPFPLIQKNEWNRIGLAAVRYFSPSRILPFCLVRTLRKTQFDILYLNSFFDPIFTLVPLLARRLGLVPDKPVVIAPRGELSPGAMFQKRIKKLVFLKLASVFGLYKNTVLHASTDLERSEIRKALGWQRVDVASRQTVRIGNKLASSDKHEIRIARDMASAGAPEVNSRPAKMPGKLNAVFISRISPKKNLIAAIEMVAKIRGQTSFHIYGPIDDSSYWRKCQQVIGKCCASMSVVYKGALTHDEVPAILASYDAFVFPTLGENFGHVILESFLAGCPVVTSDQTPWRNLPAKMAGWDLTLEAPNRFGEVLQTLADMGEEAHRLWREGAKALGVATLNDEQVLSDNEKLFADLPSD